MEDKIKDKYNTKPYFSKVFSMTQHYLQKAIAQFYGLITPNIENARILEIGCSYGGNIINTAVYFPNCEIIGIDLSDVQVNAGNKIIEDIGLTNIKLYAKNILEYNNEFGKFDYIICHGVYSWVPDIVKEKILEVIRTSLVENGVAVVSYNTYPGWKDLDVVKDIMKFRLKALKNKGVDITTENEMAYAKGAMEFLYNQNIKEINEIVKEYSEKTDYYLSHEFLEEHNNPKYLYQFVKELENKGLIHISDMNLAQSNAILKDNELQKNIDLECGKDYIAREQYFDLILNTVFRYSLITHKENKAKIKAGVDIDYNNIKELYISGKYVFDVEKDVYIFKHNFIDKSNKKIVDKLNNIYPSNIKIETLLNEVGEENLLNVIFLIIQNAVYLSTEKFEHKEIKEKIKIGERLRKYLKQNYIDKDKIMFASKKAEALTDVEIDFLLLFDGTRTLEDIEKEISKYNNEELSKEVVILLRDCIIESNDYEVCI